MESRQPEKKGINPGSNLDAVNISLSSETDGEDSSGEDSDSSLDGMQVIRNDLLRQKQVSPSTSPKENKYLAGFMKSPVKPQPDAQARQALDKDPFSLISPTKQAEDGSSDAKQGQRTGDVPGHGGSMSAPHGSLSFDPPVNAHLVGMPSAAALIRTGFLPSSSQRTDGIGINSTISAQVNIEKESVSLPQRVLGEAFCVNRLDKIWQLAGNAKLKYLTDGSDRDNLEKDITHLFRRFLRENVEGDPPYFCVSASIIGRLIHTFKEDYITRAKALNASNEMDPHVNDIADQAKESMSQDAIAIRLQTQNLIDRKNRLLADVHTRCEAALAVAHTRMKDASKAYGEAYEEAFNQQLKTVMESTITEDTLNQEMVIASQAHRDSIQKMTAIPPLVVDANRLQLQIR